jgi:two-component system chemotaxis response regulator CheB
VVIAPGGSLEVRPALPNGYHPSGDVLFSSAADVFGGGVVAVVLSGIGNDGLRGAKQVVDAGGVVLAQDPDVAAVGAMPRAVVQAGLASKHASPENLAKAIVAALESRGTKAPNDQSSPQSSSG